jgi:transcriptional regulator with XRE-family HTH domain
MGEPDKLAIRRKITGALLRHARLSAGRSQAELATSLHVSRYRYAQYEQGQRDLSLPELEVVAELCGVPLGYFFDDEAAVEDENLDILHVDKPRIRRKIVGALLRQARKQAGKLQKECSDLLGIPVRRISEYEYGKRDIPSSELEAMAHYLGVQMSYFTV